MSRKKHHRKRARKPAVTCAGQEGRGAKAFLAHLAAALNACEQAGVKVRFRHGAVYTAAGVILPPLKPGQDWAARTLTYDPLSPADAGDGLDD